MGSGDSAGVLHLAVHTGCIEIGLVLVLVLVPGMGMAEVEVRDHILRIDDNCPVVLTILGAVHDLLTSQAHADGSLAPGLEGKGLETDRCLAVEALVEVEAEALVEVVVVVEASVEAAVEEEEEERLLPEATLPTQALHEVIHNEIGPSLAPLFHLVQNVVEHVLPKSISDGYRRISSYVRRICKLK